MMALILLILLPCLASASLKSYHLTVYSDGVPKNEDVTIDEEGNYTIVTFEGDCKDNDGFRNSINLHDYNAGYLAIKDIARKQCFVVPNQFTMDDTKRRIETVMKYHEHANLTMFEMKCHKNMDKIDVEDANKMYGRRIADFCNTYKVKGVDSAPETRISRRKRSRAAKYGCLICGFWARC